MIRGLIAAVLVLALSGCASAPHEWTCTPPAQEDALKAARLVPMFRGNDAVLTDVSAATDGRHRVLAAAIEGATAKGEHPESDPDLATWIAYGDSISEVTQTWDGALPDGSTVDWPVARRAALECLSGGR